MIFSSGKHRKHNKHNKHNKRRRKPVQTGRTILRTLPSVRLPRGRAAVRTAFVLLALGLVGWQVITAYARGSLLTVQRIEVTGGRHWQSISMLERAGVDVGLRLHEIPFREARKSLQSLPGIESASIRYLPGGHLRVSVLEAEVMAVRRSSAGWRGLTPSGEWMPLAANAQEDVPVLEGRSLSHRTESRAATWLEGVRARHPDLFAGFSQVSPRGEKGEADVYWRDGKVRLRVDFDGTGDGSLEYLGELLRREQGGWAEGATVDLRVEGYAYVR